MKEFIEKLIGRLEDKKRYFQNFYECEGKTEHDADLNRATQLAYDDAISIANQLAEESNNGWIPVSSGNPKETGLYQVTVDDNDEPVITAMYLAEVDIWSYHAGYGNYMKVLAWRSLPQPYQPKGENDGR